MKSEVFNIDCMEYMRTLPDNAFQLAIADPPYGISIDLASMGQGTGVAPETNSRVKLNKSRMHGAGKLKDRAINKFDTSWDYEPPKQEFFDELFRISKNQIIGGAIISTYRQRGASSVGTKSRRSSISRNGKWHGHRSTRPPRYSVSVIAVSHVQKSKSESIPHKSR